jgi:hypothetical protein
MLVAVCYRGAGFFALCYRFSGQLLLRFGKRKLEGKSIAYSIILPLLKIMKPIM